MTEHTDRALFCRIVLDWYRSSGATWTELATRAGVSKTHLKRVAYGRGLASTDMAARLAEAIPAPSLPAIMARIRERVCPRCGITFSTDKHRHHQLYCSEDCQNIAQNERDRGRGLRGALSELRLTRDRMVAQSDAIAAFCRSCEPDGRCQMAECELRPVSPLPLSRRAAA